MPYKYCIMANLRSENERKIAAAIKYRVCRADFITKLIDRRANHKEWHRSSKGDDYEMHDFCNEKPSPSATYLLLDVRLIRTNLSLHFFVVTKYRFFIIKDGFYRRKNDILSIFLFVEEVRFCSSFLSTL